MEMKINPVRPAPLFPDMALFIFLTYEVCADKVHNFIICNVYLSFPSGRAVLGVGLRPVACWDCGFESRKRHGCLSLVSVVCCLVEVSATG
jgi:hypothetical protein